MTHESTQPQDPLVALMEQLCERLEVPAEDRPLVVNSQAFELGPTSISLVHEAPSEFVKVFIDLGRPVGADAPKLHRYLLTQQAQQAAPFSVVAGVHPETDAVFLCAAAPFPTDDAQLESFVTLLRGCVATHHTLREAAPEGIEWE